MKRLETITQEHFTLDYYDRQPRSQSSSAGGGGGARVGTFDL